MPKPSISKPSTSKPTTSRPTRSSTSKAKPTKSTTTAADKTAIINLYVAIYPNPPGYAHWTLFLDLPQQPIELEAKGSDQNFRFEERRDDGDPRNSARRPELVFVAEMKRKNVAALRAMGATQKLNRGSGWNCQDFVVELVQSAVEEGLVSVEEAKMEGILGLIEGLE